MLLLFFEYLAFAFLASMGAIQLAVSLSGLRGLWLTPWPGANRAVGALLIGGSAWWFFASGDRATPFPLLEGSQQGGTFLFAAIVATWATVFLIPLVSRAWRRRAPAAPPTGSRGLESLRARSYWPRSYRGDDRGG
ncbi:MAG: hypothetical protein HY330_01215 [Chloroflexi bacterium]|nr:hypothetical protein [Chloroflexota bacterium]